MHHTVLINDSKTKAIMLRSFHARNTPRPKPLQQQKRRQSLVGTKSYNDARQRAFNTAKQHVFFNPDLTNFITLTYTGLDHTPETVIRHIKQLLLREKRERAKVSETNVEPKYLYVMEYQKRGSIHVHMVSNDSFSLTVNKNGHFQLKYWKHGYSSVLPIDQTDGNFKPYAYLFKYMTKTQRIGATFIHTSKNLKSYQETLDLLDLEQWNTKNMEYSNTTIETTTFHYFRNYLEKHDTIEAQTK